MRHQSTLRDAEAECSGKTGNRAYSELLKAGFTDVTYHSCHPGRFVSSYALMQVLLSPERLQPVEHMPAVVDLLGFILVRDPGMRPTAGAVAER